MKNKSYFLHFVGMLIALIFAGMAAYNYKNRADGLEDQLRDYSRNWQRVAKEVLVSRGFKIDTNFTVAPDDLLRLKPQVGSNYQVLFDHNEEYLTIHLSRRLTDWPINRSTRYDDSRPSSLSLEPLILGLFDINGVEYVGLNQYEITIRRGKLFQWNNMMDKITVEVERYIQNNTSTKS